MIFFSYKRFRDLDTRHLFYTGKVNYGIEDWLDVYKLFGLLSYWINLYYSKTEIQMQESCFQFVFPSRPPRREPQQVPDKYR